MTIPSGAFLGYWPEPDDCPEVERTPFEVVSDGGAVVRGVMWGSPSARTVVALTHPRGDFAVHYACPLLAAAGYRVLGFSTRYLNNDIDCRHELAAADVIAAVRAVRPTCDHIIGLGNSGGGSLMALAAVQATEGDGGELLDAFVALAAHPGEGVFMLQVIDPSVTDEDDPLSCDPSLDMFDPDNGWRPWPEPASYEPAWVERYRMAQRERVARVDERARSMLAVRDDARERSRAVERGSRAWNGLRRAAVSGPYLVTPRTLADPAHLDPSIDPDDRPLGSIFAFPDPLDANYGWGGVGRVMTPRGWLSTWSGLSSEATLAGSLARMTMPTLVVHPTADTEIRLQQARSCFEASAASDKTYEELAGAQHYLPGRRREAIELIVEWLRARGY